ncbi:MAG: hypothetical protein NT011_09130 [Kiritimatiellaeota bacterium]|nr:hypothetical protein [Kiritimatiellota bacterium]
MSLDSLIREEASRLGFAAVGLASIGPCQTFDRFKNWLSRGYAGGLTYLARHADLRADPRQIMPEARSIIVVAARYPAEAQIQSFSNYGTLKHKVAFRFAREFAWIRRPCWNGNGRCVPA